MSSIARLIDANANRAREGLRVVEDVARFVLGDATACAELKAIRHGLGEAIRALPVDRGVLLAWRDTAGDVGTGATTAGEASRADLPAIVAAAAGRLAEALRAIEEGAQGAQRRRRGGRRGAAAVPGVRRVRRRRAGTRDGTGGAVAAVCADHRGVVRTTRGSAWRSWRWRVGRTVCSCGRRGWRRGIWWRGRALVEIVRGRGAGCTGWKPVPREGAEDTGWKPVPLVVVNDRVDVALAAGADGVHVGQGDMSVREVRQIAGNSLLVGVSTGNVEQARAAAAAGADYCGVGPMFASTTKPKAVAGVGYLREYLADAACARVPHLAIGGIGGANLGELVGAGCRGIAVSSAVCGAEEPAAVCGELRTLLAS
ncbi:MAG: hypothetical protein HND58_05885 [Planctomycetota bacterium]|nr:MAG: hypothetical protein HND58_05885 [Planctomycetota bacterium]